MVGSCDVEQQAVVAVDRDGGREPHAPVAKRRQRPAVGLGIVFGDDEVGNQGQGVGRLLPRAQAQGVGGLVDSDQAPRSAFGGQECKGRIVP